MGQGAEMMKTGKNGGRDNGQRSPEKSVPTTAHRFPHSHRSRPDSENTEDKHSWFYKLDTCPTHMLTHAKYIDSLRMFTAVQYTF